MRNILFALGLTICSTVSATTYYVSTNGNNNNPGTISAPWATWGHAFNSTAVRPGDTVYFRGGVYPMTSDNLSYPYDAGCGYNVSRDGTQGNYICFFAYPGEKPVLDCANISPAGRNSRAIWGNDMNYIHFKGLTVRNVRQTNSNVNVYGWVIEGRNIIVEACTVHDCGGRGFFSTGHEIRYLNCDSHHNYDQASSSLPGNDGVGFQNVDLTNRDGSIYYKNCRAWMNGDQGFSAVSVGYLEFDGCWSFNNGRLQGEGHGFKMGAVGIDPVPFGPLKRKYVNCVAAFNRANGWTTNDNQTFYTHLMHIYNNTSYHNGHPTSYAGVSYGFLIYNTASVDSEELARTYRNNISYQNQHGATFIGINALYTHSNNSWDTGSLQLSDADFVSLDSTGISAPRKSDGTFPDNNCYISFLRLAPGSDLIDRGYNVGLPFDGSAPDLGAFELTQSGTEPALPLYTGATVENATPSRVDLTYNLTLANIVPAASAFTVRVNTVARTVSSVTISGNRVLLTLASPVVYGDAVTVAYTKPSSNPLQTAAGGQAASFSAQNVVNNISAPTAPVYSGATVENATPSRVDLTYNL
ncbi:MAG TPA: SwmB domain-containing protein, partial [Bacteroidales bacterium]|nr:SwmB domain-containing protein [Bacteroidales bacterium]